MASSISQDAFSQRLGERWLPIRLDALGLGGVIAHDVRAVAAPTL